MRRLKIGDVYSVKLPRGYKILQYAYNDRRVSKCVRVFPGLYETIPNDISSIVNGQHSYMTSVSPIRLFSSTIFEFLGNWPIPESCTYPTYMLSISISSKGEVFCFWYVRCVLSLEDRDNNYQYFYVSSIDEVPEKYRKMDYLNGYVTPEWFLYLLDYDFDLKHARRYSPYWELGEQYESKMEEYTQIIESTSTLRKIRE